MYSVSSNICMIRYNDMELLVQNIGKFVLKTFLCLLYVNKFLIWRTCSNFIWINYG